MVKKLKKRDGRIVDFDLQKIRSAIWKAAQAVGGTDEGQAAILAQQVAELLDEDYGTKKIPTVEDVQDTLEKVLIKAGHSQTARAFILYRQKRQAVREAKSALGIVDDLKLSFDSLSILRRYGLLQVKEDGSRETPREMFERVARALARAEKSYGGDPRAAEEGFLTLLVNRDVVPSLSILRSAGTGQQQLSDGYVLPLEDDIASLFGTLTQAALLHKDQERGFGLGISFSPIRPKGSSVSRGVRACGPVAFLRLYDRALHQVNPNSSNLAFLNVHHPDIINFITAKESYGLRSFGAAVLLTKEFLRAAEEDRTYKLIDPHTQSAVTELRARSVLDMIATISWRTGDPAVVFLDQLNKAPTNPFDDLQIEATIPTGEHPLLPYEGCFTASINVAHFIAAPELDWARLAPAVGSALRMLDNAIDLCDYPDGTFKESMERTRRVGIGVIGWADTLIMLGVPYTSPEALKLAEKLMKFISTEAREASGALAKQRGTFAAYRQSASAKKNEKVRNASRTTIMAAAAASIIAGCSQGIEPYFAISSVKRTPTAETFEVIPLFEQVARREGFYSEALMKSIALAGSIQQIKEIPERWRPLFVTAHDCSVGQHLAMQAAFQKHTDNAVSKTINLPAHATIREVEELYTAAYALGCKSVHSYREGSTDQLIHSRLDGVKRSRKRVSREVS